MDRMSARKRWPKAAAWARDKALMALSVAARVLDDLMSRWGELSEAARVLAVGRAASEVHKALIALKEVQGPLPEGDVPPEALLVWWDAWRGQVNAETIALAQSVDADALPDALGNLVKMVAGGNEEMLESLNALAQEEAREVGWLLGDVGR